MIQTFTYRTETPEHTYHQTIHAVDITNSVNMWLTTIEDLQDQVYSFNKAQVDSIKQQYASGQLKFQFHKEPCFLTFRIGDKIQFVHIDMVKKREPDFLAEIYYFSTEQGGRFHYASSGFRPQVKFDGRNEMTSGEQLFADRSKVFPGETVRAETRLLSPHFFNNFLFVGQGFDVKEGLAIVGRGKVLAIINPLLIKVSQ